VTISITQTGGREVRAILDGMARRTTDMSPALAEVADWIRGEWRTSFDTAGRNLDRPWRPLKATTRQVKAERGYDPRVLVRRGDLMRSLTERGHTGHVETITPGELRLGTRSRVVPLLRAGGRDPIQPPADMAPAARIIERWIERGKA